MLSLSFTKNNQEEKMTFEGNTHHIKNVSKKEMDGYYALIEKRAVKSCTGQVKYLTLGNLTLKIENCVEELATHIETQLAYCLKDEADSYDCTFFIWKDDVKSYVTDFAQGTPGLVLYQKNSNIHTIEIYTEENKLSAYNPETKTHYFSIGDFSVDLIRKMGHLFVKQLSDIAQMAADHALVHAAAVGIDDQGVLICARGGGGKSTLAVSAMLAGFQYVADDYVILSKTEAGQLYAHPIYSTINLFPSMQEQLDGLNAKFIHKSYWQPDKNTLDISAHHDRFVHQLPVNVVIFPQIGNVEIPSIEPMDEMGKRKAIVQLVHSTISQMQETRNHGYIKLLMSLVSGLDFYRINLSPDLNANVKLLKQFIKKELNYVRSKQKENVL
jgi:hypothetical protein